MENPKIIIVNENDEVIGHKKREIIESSDIYRVSTLWIKNSNGDVLLAQRKFTKKNNPGKWGPAVAGTNEEGETYKSNILKESEEEIDLVDFEPKLKDTVRVNENNKHNFFASRFLTIVDKDISEFKIQESEVEQIKWFKEEELLEELQKNPSNFLDSIKEFFYLFKE